MAEEISKVIGLILSKSVITIFKIIKGFIIGLMQGISGVKGNGKIL